MRRALNRRTIALPAAVLLAVGALGACSSSSDDPADDIDAAVLLPQSLFPNGGAVSECPEVPDDAPEDTTGTVPRAVCITVENSGEDRATYTVPVTVQSKDDDPIVYSQVTVTTQPIDAGATGAAAVAAPGAEKVLDDWAEGQKDAQEAQGFDVINDVQLKIGTVTRTAG